MTAATIARSSQAPPPALLPRRPRIGIVGPMLGGHAGWVTTQGEILVECFRAAGYDVTSTSSVANRYVRLADIITTLVRRARTIDLLIVETYGGPSFVVETAATLIGRTYGSRVVLHVHGGALPEFLARFPRLTRHTLRRAHAAVAPSAFLGDVFRRHGVATRVIPNIIAPDTYPYQRRESVRPRLFWMRCFDPIYNPSMALRVLARVRAVHPDATLVMAGQDAGLEGAIRREADALGLGSSVRFPGFLDHAGKCREGSAADVYLNTNHIDNTPVAVLEAGAMGLPIVSTDVGGMATLLRGGRGLLVGANDDAAMASAVLRLVATPVLAARLSAAGREMARQAAWTAALPAYEALFAELLDGARMPVGSR